MNHPEAARQNDPPSSPSSTPPTRQANAAAPRAARRWLRRTLIVVGLLAGLALLAAAAGLLLAERRVQRHIEVAVMPVDLPADAASLARGRYLFESRGCADCHGGDGGGRFFVDQPPLRLAGPDITAGGRTATYRIDDWVRAVRHGVGPDGRPLRVMPSDEYNRLTDADLGALVSYVRQLPARGGARAVVELPLPARVLYGFGLLPDAADRIDHRLAPSAPVPEGVTAEHGRYVAQMCTGCHGPGLGGGRIPGAPPDWPAAANLTPGEGGVLARYPDAESFARMMRSGRRTDGSRIAVMPFEALAKMSDTDLHAMHLFLRTVEPRAMGSR